MAYDGYLTFDTQINTSGFQNDANKLSSIVKGLGVFKLFEKGMQMITDSLDSAMGRIDTMEQFDRVMSTMTGSVSKTNRALETTKDIVTDTAYGLDVAAKSVQNFVSRGMEVSNATETVEAWGNAVAFYGDGSNESFSSVTEALSKMQTKGTVTMEHMEMLLNAGIPAIDIYADAMSTSSDKITDAMSKGETSADSFIYAMNEALESGTTKFPSVANAAKEAGASWSGTFDNMKAAVTRGTQSIITAIDDTLEELGKPTMREVIADFGKKFEVALNTVADVAAFVVKHLNLIATAALVVGTVIAAWKIGSVMMSFIDRFNKATWIVSYFTSTLKSAVTVEALHNSQLSIKQMLVGVLTGKISLATAAQYVWNAAISANPIGLIIAAIGALIIVIGSLTNWFKGASEEAESEANGLEELKSSHEELTDEIESSGEAYAKEKESLKSEQKEVSETVKALDRLIKKELKTSSEKKKIVEITEDLNDKVDGLNLAYDEESDKLSMSIESVKKYSEAKAKLDDALLAEERLNELLDEHVSLENQIADITAAKNAMGNPAQKQQATNAELKEYNDLLAEEDEIERQIIENANQQSEVKSQLRQLDKDKAQAQVHNIEEEIAAEERLTEALEEETEKRTEALGEYTDMATDFFDEIKTNSDVTVESMVKTLETNQTAMITWADGIEELANKVDENGNKMINEALIQRLRDAGPEAASEVAALLKAVETGATEPLQRLNELFENSTGLATDAVKTEFGDSAFTSSGSEAIDAIALGIDANDSMGSAAKTTVVNAKTSAVEQVRASNFNSIGQMIVWGIVDGLSQTAYLIYNKIRAICKQAYKAAKDENEINSPSKLYRRGIGLGTMEGWAYGVEDGEDDVLDAYLRTSERIRNAVQSNAKISTGGFVDRLRSAVAENNMLFAFSAVPAYSAASVQGGYTTNLYQTINTHDSLSPAELTREAEDFLTRSKWRLP